MLAYPYTPVVVGMDTSSPECTANSSNILGLLASTTTTPAARESGGCKRTLMALPCGSVVLKDPAANLTIAVPAGVHIDVKNFELHSCTALATAVGFLAASASTGADFGVAPRVFYAGCGAGVLGLLLLRVKAASFVTFADCSRKAVEIAEQNCITNGFARPLFDTKQIDLIESSSVAVSAAMGSCSVVLSNPPQMPGPPGLH